MVLWNLSSPPGLLSPINLELRIYFVLFIWLVNVHVFWRTDYEYDSENTANLIFKGKN